MNEKEAKRVFDNSVAFCKSLGGDLKIRCLEKGLTEEQFEKFFRQYERLSEFINKHDSEGNLKQARRDS